MVPRRKYLCLCAILFQALVIQKAVCWQEWRWDYIKVYNETLRRVILQALENNVTLNETLGNGTLAISPEGRRGHSINMIGDDLIVIFGGRGPEK